MTDVLTPLDIFIFFTSLLCVMGFGLWAGRKEETAEDFYLAGKTTRWWGVAGSIFGSNVSANHLIGMMGVGFAIGFAQSHFEITAIAGLLLLCYGFLPVYRKLNLYTLSEYLGRRYNEGCRISYAVIMIIIMVVIQMVPGFYIGSRSINILLQGGPGEISQSYYTIGILVMALVTGTYTIVGGLKAVIVTDVIQSVLMLLAGLLVAFIMFSQPEIGGWGSMVAMDSAASGEQRLHLYNASNHPELPWTGVLSGILVLHFYYWSSNQFIVQRALSARSDREARLGIIAAGFFKLLIPFFAIGTGIAAFYWFRQKGMVVDQDAVFTTLLTELVAPIGYGVVGIVAAGVIGAILSSIDSMMNSSATILTFDIYKRYINPEASDKKLILVGRIAIAVFIMTAAFITIFTMDPNSSKSFFLQIASHQSKLIAGLVVAFGLGMLWPRATGAGGLTAIFSGAFFSYVIPVVYAATADGDPDSRMVATFGMELNFLHTVALSAGLSLMLHVIVSLNTQQDLEKSKLTWVGLNIFSGQALRQFAKGLGVSIVLFILLAFLMVSEVIRPGLAAVIAALWTWGLILVPLVRSRKSRSPQTAEVSNSEEEACCLLAEDRFWGALLASLAVFMLFYYY
jgi:SSS family solute:Na+ symporter